MADKPYCNFGFILPVLAAAMLLFSCASAKMLRYNESDVDDYRIFPNRELKASTEQSGLEYDNSTAGALEYLEVDDTLYDLDALLEENDTLAFIAIKNDRIIKESYYNGHSRQSISYSFSMAKSITSMLIGIAIDEGLIKSEEQFVTEFVPELSGRGFERVRLRHLLQMTSGSDYIEADHPFCVHPYFYYTDDQMYWIKRMRVVDEPGTVWRYKSGDSELLGLVLQRALKDRTLTQYLQENIWTPLGMEHDALWSVDHLPDGIEKTYCCIAATARDFARIGRLYLHGGDWNGRRIVSREWVEKSTSLDTFEGSPWFYQYQWWKLSEDGSDFMAIGHLGQYLYVNQSQNLIIVRLGTSRGNMDNEGWKKLLAAFVKQLPL